MGPGRPRALSKDAEVLRAAAARLAEDGYVGMSVGDVARLAQVSKPTIYLRFSTKQRLALAVIADLGQRLLQAMSGEARNAATLLAESANAARGLQVIEVLRGASCGGPDAEILTSAISQQVLEPWSALLKRKLAAHGIPEDTSNMMVTTILGEIVRSALERRPTSPDVIDWLISKEQ